MRRRFPWLDDLVVILFAFAATAYTDRKIRLGGTTYESDARLHEYWMRRFQDQDLFQDPLTEALLQTGYIPHGFRAFYWTASHVVDPVQLAELMPLVLAPLSTWLVFRIVRLHTDWQPAAWLGAALYLLALDLHRFTGGHQRAFGPPIVLLTVFLLMRRRLVWAALVPPIGVLFYPTAGLLALGVLALSSLDRAKRRWVDLRHAAIAAASAAAAALAALLPPLASGHFPEVIARSEAERYPDFGPNTDVHFFIPSTLEFLSQKASGFGFQWSGSILVLAALALFALRPRNALLPRLEVWAMAVVALALFGLAHAFLFRLYLPHRYAYPLVPFLAIFIALAWKPTWEALAARGGRFWLSTLAAVPVLLAIAFLALAVFPFGFRLPVESAASTLADNTPHLAGALAVGLLTGALVYRPGRGWIAGAAVAGVLLVGEVAVAGGDRDPGVKCGPRDLHAYLRTLPKDTVIAGNPTLLDCVPLMARRAVVMNEKLFQVWEVRFWRFGRRRMFDSVRAYWGDSVPDILKLRDRYGADYLVVEDVIRISGWRRAEPFTTVIRHLRETVETPAVHRLPRECVTWRGQRLRVYDLACVAGRSDTL